MRSVLMIVLASSLVCSCGLPAVAENRLSNAAAKDAIERLLNPHITQLRIGPLVVLSPMSPAEPSLEKRVITQATYDEYAAWAKLGVISITVDQKFEAYKSGKQFSWEQYMETISGTGSKIVVAKTPKGEALPGALSTSGYLIILNGARRVTKIVENNGYRGSGSDWRLVYYLSTVAWEPIVREYASLMQIPVTDQHKTRILLKYDPFGTKWQVVAYDEDSADAAEFKTDRVSNSIRANQLIPVEK